MLLILQTIQLLIRPQFIQCLIAVLLLRLLSWVNTTSLRRVNPIDWETPKIHRGVMVNLFPYFAVGISGLVFNTLCLTNVDASFFQASPSQLDGFML